MEASSSVEPHQQQGPPSAAPHALTPSTEQQPNTVLSILHQHRDARPIELQDHDQETSTEKSEMDTPPQHHHPKPNSLIEDHHKEPSVEKDTASEHHHSQPFEPSSEKNLVDKPSPVQGHQKEASIEENLMEVPLEHHHSAPSEHHQNKAFELSSEKKLADTPSSAQEHHKDTSIEKNLTEAPLQHHVTKPSPTQEHQKEPHSVERHLMDTPAEQHHTKSSIVQEHHKEPSREKGSIDMPSEHHHTKPSLTQEPHKELFKEMDALTVHHNAKPSEAQDHHKEPASEKNPVEHDQVESLTEVHQTAEDNPTDPSRKAPQKDHPIEQQHINSSVKPHSSAEEHYVDLSIEGQPVESLPPQQQPVPPAVSLQHQAQHSENPFTVQDKTDPLVELSSQQQQINPVFEQHQVDLTVEQKQLTSPSKEQHSDLSTQEKSLLHSTDVPTGHHTIPSSEQHHIDLPREQPYINPSKGGDLEPSAEESQLQSPSIAHEASSALETPSIQVTDHTHAREESPRLSEATLSAEVHGNFAEEPTTKGSQIHSLGSSQKPTRAEIDTAAPFESVKAAVSLFGERMDWKSQQRTPQLQVSSVERRILPESEHHKVQEDLVCYKDQLALTQASTAGVLLELKKVKRLIQRPSSKQEGTNPSKDTGAAFTDKPANVELQTILREVESVKAELISATVSKEVAVKGLQDALSSLNNVFKRVDELAGEKAGLDEAVADAHVALADAEEQVALLRSGGKVNLLNSVPGDFMEKKSVEVKGLESKLEEAKAMVSKLKAELLASKESETMADAAATETQQKVAKVKLELEQAKAEELSMVSKLAKILEESDELKAKLEKATQESATLSSTVELLKSDVERVRVELAVMHEKEQMACATLASLQDELHKVKEALQSAQAGEARALQAKGTLPAAIKQAASEADEAKAAAEASKEKTRKARQEIEQAKAATSTAMSRQQAALKELEAARASEAMALADLKALTESESQGADMESEGEGMVGVTISLEEYSALKQAAVEAEGLADRKVAEVIAQVEEAKASQLKAQAKLDDAVKEAQRGRDELQKAQKQADDAQESKVTAEADLRKWRAEHDQRRKSGGAPLDLKAGTTQSSQRKPDSDEKAVKSIFQEKEGMLPPLAAQGKRVAGRDSLAQVMSLEVPATEKRDRVLPVENLTNSKEKVKKKNFIRRIVSIVALKKNP
eukprot:c24168_g1_i2 orf=608-4192(-)